jgi:hypothetical protein
MYLFQTILGYTSDAWLSKSIRIKMKKKTILHAMTIAMSIVRQRYFCTAAATLYCCGGYLWWRYVM